MVERAWNTGRRREREGGRGRGERGGGDRSRGRGGGERRESGEERGEEGGEKKSKGREGGKEGRNMRRRLRTEVIFLIRCRRKGEGSAGSEVSEQVWSQGAREAQRRGDQGGP